MSIIWEAITHKSCANCSHMPCGKGYLCTKLNQDFREKADEIDRGLMPCSGLEFKHYAANNPMPIHVVDEEGGLIGILRYPNPRG